jgi:O-antigen/teichoic acid export membrane protein/GT2 family glycosyltransferase
MSGALPALRATSATPAVGVSVVICAYTTDRWGQLQRAVASVVGQQVASREVLVVIDHNADLLALASARWPAGDAPAVRVLENAGERGLSGARNTGVQAASSELVAFLDDDAEAAAGWTEQLGAPFADADVVACGGFVAASLRGDGRRPGWWPLEFDWVIGCSYVGLPTGRSDVRNVIGANMAMRRQPVLDAGGFATGVGRVGTQPLGCEETDLCIRLAQQAPGARVVYEPAAAVRHYVAPERLSWSYFGRRCYAEGRSKATVAARVGSQSALASERSYVSKVLPAGVMRGLAGAARGDWRSGLRALAIVAGLLLTVAGYLRGGAGRLRRAERLDSTALALMATTVTTSALGVAFWTIASRRYPAASVGRDAALISAMMLLSIVSQLNLGNGLTRLLPQFGRRRGRLVLTSYLVTGAVAAVLTGAFVLVAPSVSDSFSYLGGSWGLAVALVIAVVAWNVFALQDAALTSSLWARVLPVENGVFGVLKIVLVLAAGGMFAGHGIFAAWLAAMVVMLLPMNALLFGRALRGAGPRASVVPSRALAVSNRRSVVRYLSADYAAGLLSQGYNAVLPLLVISALGHATGAYFYVAFLIATAAASLAQSLSTSLIVEGAHDETRLAALARHSARRYFTSVVPGIAALGLLAPLLLAPFGAEYAERATPVLRLLLLGAIPQGVVAIYLGVERVRARMRRVIAVEALTVVLVSGGALVAMGPLGLAGVGVAWCLGHTAVALAVAVPLRGSWPVRLA